MQLLGFIVVGTCISFHFCGVAATSNSLLGPEPHLSGSSKQNKSALPLILKFRFEKNYKFTKGCYGAHVQNLFELQSAHWIMPADCFDETSDRFSVYGYIDKQLIPTNYVEYFGHPDYNPTTKAHNIALLSVPYYLSVNNGFDYIQMPSTKDTINDKELEVYEYHNMTLDPQKALKRFKTKAINSFWCKILYPMSPIQQNRLCASGWYAKGLSKDDHGVPLIIRENDRFKMVGMANIVRPWTHKLSFPIEFLNIHPYLDWINSVITNNSYTPATTKYRRTTVPPKPTTNLPQTPKSNGTTPKPGITTTDATQIATNPATTSTGTSKTTPEPVISTTDASITTPKPAITTTEATQITTNPTTNTTDVSKTTQKPAVSTTDASKTTPQPAITTAGATQITTNPATTNTDASKTTPEPVISTTDASKITPKPVTTTTHASKTTLKPAITTTHTSKATTNQATTTDASKTTLKPAITTTDATTIATNRATTTTDASKTTPEPSITTADASKTTINLAKTTDAFKTTPKLAITTKEASKTTTNLATTSDASKTTPKPAITTTEASKTTPKPATATADASKTTANTVKSSTSKPLTTNHPPIPTKTTKNPHTTEPPPFEGQKYSYSVTLDIMKHKTPLRLCGGAQIGLGWVLTAAECLQETEASAIVMTYSNDMMEYQRRLINMKSAMLAIHPEYNPKTKANNLALIKCEKCAEEKKYTLPTLPLRDQENYTLDQEPAVISTVMEIKNDDKIYGFYVHPVMTKIVSNSWCKAAHFFLVEKNHICASRSPGKLPRAEIGAPLVIKGHLLGRLQLIGIGTSIERWPTWVPMPMVFTKVEPYSDWIRSVTIP